MSVKHRTTYTYKHIHPLAALSAFTAVGEELFSSLLVLALMFLLQNPHFYYLFPLHLQTAICPIELSDPGTGRKRSQASESFFIRKEQYRETLPSWLDENICFVWDLKPLLHMQHLVVIDIMPYWQPFFGNPKKGRTLQSKFSAT